MYRQTMVSINHGTAGAEGNFHEFNVFKGILLRNCEFIARENERVCHKRGGEGERETKVY